MEHIEHRKMALTYECIAKETIEIWKEKWWETMWQGELWRNVPKNERNERNILHMERNGRRKQIHLKKKSKIKVRKCQEMSLPGCGDKCFVVQGMTLRVEKDGSCLSQYPTHNLTSIWQKDRTVASVLRRTGSRLWNRLCFCGCRKLLRRPKTWFHAKDSCKHLRLL